MKYSVKSTPTSMKGQPEDYQQFDELLQAYEVAKSGQSLSLRYKGLLALALLITIGAIGYLFWPEPPVQADRQKTSPVKTVPIRPEPATPAAAGPVMADSKEDLPAGGQDTKAKNPAVARPKATRPKPVAPVLSEEPVSTPVDSPEESPASAKTVPVPHDQSLLIPDVDGLEAIESEQRFIQAQPIPDYQSLYQYLEDNLEYPAAALADSLSGTVLVGFEIDTAGQAVRIHVLESLSPLLDAEALRLVGSMPAWQPARLAGRPISSELSIPLRFEFNRD